MISKTYDTQYEPSPVYPFRNSGSVTTTSPFGIELDKNGQAYQKYIPFTNCRISNKSSVHVFVYPNDDDSRKILIPSGTILDLSPSDVPAWRNATFYSQSGTVNANELEVIFWREGVTTTTLLQNLHRKLFGRQNEFIV